MKKIFKYLSVTALSGILVLSLAVTANDITKMPLKAVTDRYLNIFFMMIKN